MIVLFVWGGMLGLAIAKHCKLCETQDHTHRNLSKLTQVFHRFTGWLGGGLWRTCSLLKPSASVLLQSLHVITPPDKDSHHFPKPIFPNPDCKACMTQLFLQCTPELSPNTDLDQPNTDLDQTLQSLSSEPLYQCVTTEILLQSTSETKT